MENKNIQLEELTSFTRYVNYYAGIKICMILISRRMQLEWRAGEHLPLGMVKRKSVLKVVGAVDDSKTSTLSKEVKSTTVVGGNILKDALDTKILPDSRYPDWL
ncbi:54S ribosomal L37, mitochondrial-like [Olea europaea subsp. europaea]|uniref:Large ribosomal subunit protein mL54 n=1 Tax=Olea europaea subsp. europaea TaxID=158383 RepID=A0A8S0SRA2_OLEEU|nr:54S ribosomal L37, mitochondrial-like [Olea europaea subsp. europaea]